MRSVSEHLTIHATLAIPRPHRPGRVSVLRNILGLEDIEYELGLIDWSPLYVASHIVDILTLLQYLIDLP